MSRNPRYALTATELKAALHDAVQRKHGGHLEGYVNATVIWDRTTRVIAGAEVWYTKRWPKQEKP